MSIIKTGYLTQFVVVLLMFVAVYYYVRQGEKGKKYFVRRIAGVDAMDEALERATEMGGTVFTSVGDVAVLTGIYVDQTMAGLEVVEHISRHCARLKTNLIVALMGQTGEGGDLIPIHREIVRNAYQMEGKPEDYRDDIVRYLGGTRYGYETAIYNVYVKEKVVTNVLVGAWAGSIPQPTMIANSMGIVNITGTARTYQMPLQACVADYFMFGEEIYAAGAVLSEDPTMIASLRLNHISKYPVIGLIVLGSIIFWVFGNNIVKTLLSF